MPRRHVVANGSLDVSLDNGRSVYAFGETITGTIGRVQPLASPRVHVNVTLWGRSKVRYTKTNNDNESRTYRSDFILVNGHAHRQLIFDGALHIPPDGSAPKVWQFALATPTHVSPAVGVDRFQGYLPADPLSASVQPLPPSFEIARGCSNTASIEYYLEVRMLVTNGGVMYETHRVTVPLLIRSLHPGLPLRSFQMSFLLWPGHVGSQCLVPGMTEADLSATQKFKKFLHTSSVPQFHFYLEVGLPTHVQLDGVCSTPFNLRVVPDWPKTTEGIRNISQMVHLAGVELELASRTEVLHDQDGGPHDDVIVNAVGFSMNQALGVVRKEIRLPCHPSSQPLNIGDLTKLRFQSQALPTTYPSLETYNIRYRHRLVWKITLRIVGEDRKIRGDTPVVILPPSFGQPMVLSPMPRPPPHTSVPASSLSSHSIQTNASRPAPVCRSEQSDTLPNPPPPPYSLHPPEI